MDQPIFKMKRVGLVGGRPVDGQYMQFINARAKRLQAAARPAGVIQTAVVVSSCGAVQLDLFSKTGEKT